MTSLKNKRDVRLSFRLSLEEQTEIKSQSKIVGLSLSDYIRKSLMSNPKFEPVKFSHENLELKKSMIFEIKKIGNNLNQISRHSNQNKFDFSCIEMQSKLINIERLLMDISMEK